MEGQGGDLMEMNGNTSGSKEIYLLQGETILPIQLGSLWGFGADKVVFLQAKDEIGICYTIHAMWGNVVPIIQEQWELHQEM